MKSLTDIFEAPGRALIANAPEGVEAWLLAEPGLAGGPGGLLLYVCRDDVRLARLAGALTEYLS